MSGKVGRLYAAAASLLAFGGMLAVLAGRTAREPAEPRPPAARVLQTGAPAARIVELPPITETRSS